MDSEYDVRLSKAEEIKKSGIDPYPSKFDATISIEGAIGKYHSCNDAFEVAKSVDSVEVIGGRIMLKRNMGKSIFMKIKENNFSIQVLIHKEIANEGHKFAEHYLDIGDFVGIKGSIFRTHKGELTILAKEVNILCKAIAPLPDKHKKLSDKEIIYRKRWLDLIVNESSLNLFKMRSKILYLVREYYHKKGYLEVETPILEKYYGGANAKPFETEFDALKSKFFLRISTELSLKKIIVGGFSKIFEMGRVFRNEGTDATHNPEFTSLESYEIWANYEQVISLVEGLYEFIAMELFGSTKIGKMKSKNGDYVEIDLKAPWKRLTFVDAIKQFAKVDITKFTEDDMKDFLLSKSNITIDKIEKSTRGLLECAIFEKFVEENLSTPHFIIDYPLDSTPLCKMKASNNSTLERFEGYISGMEICNGYSELNDPKLQRDIMAHHNGESGLLDETFLDAIDCGMPPTGGVGLGIDRLVMLFTNSSYIRDVILFPAMKSTK